MQANDLQRKTGGNLGFVLSRKNIARDGAPAADDSVAKEQSEARWVALVHRYMGATSNNVVGAQRAKVSHVFLGRFFLLGCRGHGYAVDLEMVNAVQF